MLKTSFRASALLLVATYVVLSPGCGGGELFTETRVLRQEDAGFTHVSVISVAPFEEFKEKLKPNFAITGDRALQMVVPTTRVIEETYHEVIKALLKVALPTLSQTETRKESEKTIIVDGRPTKTSTTEKNTASEAHSGDVTKVEAQHLQPRPAESTPEKQPPQLIPLTIEPILQYTAANALFQEVQLLNHYIQHIPLRTENGHNYIPYIVRLQVSVMPTARHMPYDVFCNTSFFCGPIPGFNEPSKKPSTVLAIPEVVPLLVTDAFEATAHSKSIDQVRQIALGLLGMVQQVGLEGQFQGRTEELKEAFGRDLNSLLTVGKVSQNTIRVRLGAMQEIQANHAMMPQTHNVTVLLLVPPGHPYRKLHLRTRQEMYDTKTGAKLRGRTPDEVAAKRRSIITKYQGFARDSGDKLKLDDKFIDHLMTAAVAGDVKTFDGLLTKHFKSINDSPKIPWWKDNLWEELVSFALGNQFSIATFDLPEVPLVTLPPQAKAEYVILDSGDSSEVVITGASNLQAGTIVVTMVALEKRWAPREIAVAGGGKVLICRFPSLAKWIPNDTQVTLEISAPLPTSYVCRYLTAPAAPLGFQMYATSSKVDTAKGKATILVNFTILDPQLSGKVYCSIRGATFETIDPTPKEVAVFKNGEIQIVGTGQLKIPATNFETSLVVEAFTKEGKSHPPLILEVRKIE